MTTKEILDSPEVTAIVDKLSDDMSVSIRCWDGQVFRVAAGQTVGDLKVRLGFGFDFLVLRLGKVLLLEDILQPSFIYQIFPIGNKQ